MKRITQHLTGCAYAVCLLFFLHPQETVAQTAVNEPENTIKPLKVGDNVPDIFFEKVLNYNGKKAKLSDFKNKLVILDMWSTTCTSCIAAFPKMENIQNEFKDQIQILLVNPYDDKYNTEEIIRRTLEKNKKRTGFFPSLPIPVHDTLLNNYFTHLSVPHLVWIGSGRKVVAITSSIEFTAENVQKVLDHKTLDLAVKNDWGFDRTKPLLIDGNGGNPKSFIFRAVLTGYKKGISGGGQRINANGEVIGICILNNSMRNLVSSAYYTLMQSIRYKPNRIFLNVKNESQFKWEADTAYTYCYDLTFPPIKSDSANVTKYLREDLKRYFNVRAYKEIRKLPCLVVAATSKVKPSSKKDDQHEFDFDEHSIKKFIHNYTVGEVLHLLDPYGQKPLIDETGISKQKINIDFPENVSLYDVDVVANALKKAGFSIREEERELDVVVITDK